MPDADTARLVLDVLSQHQYRTGPGDACCSCGASPERGIWSAADCWRRHAAETIAGLSVVPDVEKLTADLEQACGILRALTAPNAFSGDLMQARRTAADFLAEVCSSPSAPSIPHAVPAVPAAPDNPNTGSITVQVHGTAAPALGARIEAAYAEGLAAGRRGR